MAILDATLLSLVAGLATGLGGLLVALLGKLSMRSYDALLGFAAGVMTSIATLGLILEASTQTTSIVPLVGVAVGAAALFAFDRFLPHQHLGLERSEIRPSRRAVLLFAAITLHNIPEGLAVGTGYAYQPRLGLVLALAIALHNIPEGMAVAAPLRAGGMSRLKCVAWATASGLAEPLAAVIGATFATFFSLLLPFALAFAGGAMLYVVSDELIPESHSHGYEHEATFGFVVGFILLLSLMRYLR
jgi:ZIP family zinc transporter